MSAPSAHALDFVDVAVVLQDYFDGLYHSDTTRLRRVFHPRAGDSASSRALRS
jgi:hypothetical protein